MSEPLSHTPTNLPEGKWARIAVIGSSGSGKSTLARQLGARLSLPIIHLDRHYWRSGWVESDPETWQETVRRLAARDRWVIDGNYSSTMDIRLAAADTIIYLDFPRLLCMWRAFRRWLTYRGRTRPDLPPDCPEKLDLAFLRWIWNYPTRSRPATLRRLTALEGQKEIIRLHSPREVRAFLERVPSVTKGAAPGASGASRAA